MLSALNLLLSIKRLKIVFEQNFFFLHCLQLEFNYDFQGTWRSNGNGNFSLYSNGSLTPGFPDGNGSEWSLAMSPPPSDEAKYSMVRPKNLVERARMNVA